MEKKISDIDESFLIDEYEKSLSNLFEKKGSRHKNSRLSLRSSNRLVWAIELLRRSYTDKPSPNVLIEKILWDFIRRGSFNRLSGDFKVNPPLMKVPELGLAFLSGINPFNREQKSFHFQTIIDFSWSYFKIFRLMKLYIICSKNPHYNLISAGEEQLILSVAKDEIFWKKSPRFKEQGSIDFSEAILNQFRLLVAFGEWEVSVDNEMGTIGSSKMIDEIVKLYEAPKGYESEELQNRYDQVKKNLSRIRNNDIQIGLINKIEKFDTHDEEGFFFDYISNIEDKKVKLDDAAFNEMRFINFEIKSLYKLLEKQIKI